MILQDALRLIDSFDEIGGRRTFDVQYVRADRQRRTGGQLVELKGVRKIGSQFNQSGKQMINVQAPGNTGHPYPIHIRLITAINGEKVYW